jgi:hypothetical protein
MKKLIAGLGVFSLAFAFVGLASASTVTDDSSLTVSRTSRFNATFFNRNNVSGDIFVASSASSGGNTITAEDDLEDSSLMSGDADAAAGIHSSANNIDNDVMIEMTGTNHADPGTNVDDDSDATHTVDERTVIDSENRNNSDVNLTAVSGSSSGDNHASGDDVEGFELESGTAINTVLIDDQRNNLVNRFEIRFRSSR